MTARLLSTGENLLSLAGPYGLMLNTSILAHDTRVWNSSEWRRGTWLGQALYTVRCVLRAVMSGGLTRTAFGSIRRL